jgi:hypothetical protein
MKVPTMDADAEKRVNKNEDADSEGPLSRRRFVGLSLGALGSLLAACQQGTVAPAATHTSVSMAEGSPQPSPSVGLTPIPPSPTPSPTPSASPSSSPVSPSPVALPADTAKPQATGVTPLPPTYTPVPATPTSPPAPTATPIPPLSRAALMAHWPATEVSRVVVVRHSGVWAGSVPDSAVVLQMLDDGLRALTGVADVLSTWRALFDPGDKVLLKVNCIAYGGPTQPAVTYAVAQRLQDADLRGEDILIFDRTDHELAAAGYTLNEDGPGVRCHGSRGEGSEMALSQARIRFFQELDACDAIINLPTPKQHGSAGISVSLKNHYGSINRPGSLHGSFCDPGIAELNAQPNIRDKTRLCVAAALAVSPFDWNRPEPENALLLSFDPVALDTVARDILVRHRQAAGRDAGFLVDGARHLRTAQSLSLGATEAGLIDLKEVVLA